MGIKFYCGINETKWNHHPIESGDACIAPVYGSSERTRTENRVAVPSGVSVIQDSGAFSDGPRFRLSLQDALVRQLTHAGKYKYSHQIEAVASYDLLIDEKWDGFGVRHKSRWTEQEASEAVSATIEAARYITSHRYLLPGDPSLVLSAQGVTPSQYLECARRVIWNADLSRDWLGLGGWCITGKMPKIILPSFYETIKIVIPWAAQSGVKRIHIWGVVYPKALGPLLWLCNQYKIELSTDSSGPSVKPCFGCWGYSGWRDPGYQRPPVSIRGLERAKHVSATRKWLSELEDSPFYVPPPDKNHQLQMDI